MTDPDAIFVILSSEEFDDDGRALYWSNTEGWVPADQATRFTEQESQTLSLPADSFWAELAVKQTNPLWDDNLFQFPRLLCEINATQELDLPALAESMDLTLPDVIELFDRADDVWELAKQAGFPRWSSDDPTPLNDHQAMDTIHQIMDASEWSADTLDAIADIVRLTSREIPRQRRVRLCVSQLPPGRGTPGR